MTRDQPANDARVTVAHALKALTRIREEAVSRNALALLQSQENDLSTLAQFIAERSQEVAPAENTGLPCVYCGEKLKRLDVQKDDAGDVVVRISTKVKPSEIKALAKILTMFKE